MKSQSPSKGSGKTNCKNMQSTTKYTSKRKNRVSENFNKESLNSFFDVNSEKDKKTEDFIPLFVKKENKLSGSELIGKKKKKEPRPVNKDLLSSNQKRFVGLTMFEKDVLIVKDHQEKIRQYEESMYRKETNSEPIKRTYSERKNKIPKQQDGIKITHKENKCAKKPVEKKVNIKVISDDLYEKLNKHITPQEIEEMQNEYNCRMSQREVFQPVACDFIPKYNENDSETSQTDQEQQCIPTYKTTRSQVLKTNINKLKMLKMDASERREVVNAELRARAEVEAQERMKIRPNKLRPIDNADKNMRDKRAELRNNSENYEITLDKINTSIQNSQTILEKAEYDGIARF